MKLGFSILILMLAQFASAQEIRFQTGHTHDILEVKFSPDDTQLISYSAADGRLCLWEVKTGHLVWMTQTGFIQKGDEHYNLKEFYWSRDRTRLVTSSMNGTFQTWDAQTGKIMAISENRPAVDLLMPTRKASSIKKSYEQLDVIVPKTKHREEIKKFGNSSAFDTSNSGIMIAEGGSWGDASIRITNIETGKSWWLDGHPSVVKAMTYSPDGHSLAVGGSDKNIYIFDPATPKLSRVLFGHTKPITSMAFSADGKILISGQKNEFIKVWQLPTGKLLRDISFGDGIHNISDIQFSHDGTRFLVVCAGELKIWDTRTLSFVRSIATSERYESTSGNMTIGYGSVPISGGMFIDGAARIMTAHVDGSLRTWDANSGRQLTKLVLGNEMSLVQLTPDEKAIIAATGHRGDIEIKMFDVKHGTETMRFAKNETRYLDALVLSNVGKHFATSDVSGDILLWDLTRNSPTHHLDIGFSGDDAIAFSPDSKTLAVGGRSQNLFLFDVVTGNKLWQLIPSYQESELETRFENETQARRAKIKVAEYEREKQAAIDNEKYQDQVYITFEHYGDMTDPGKLRLAESSEPKLSKVKRSATDASAVWLRLHNASPLPIQIPTQSMYLPEANCFHEFAGDIKIPGLCDNREIAIWFGLEDQKGKVIPYGFDFGAATILLPKTSALFAVPREILRNGSAIRFGFTFQNDNGRGEISDYGKKRILRFTESELP